MATTYTHIAANKRRSVLLMVFFLVFIVALGYSIDAWSDSGVFFLGIALFLAITMSIGGYFAGDKVALWSSGARPIRKEDNPYLYRMVENLCITSGLPLPQIYIIPDQAMNAFATGRDPKHASLAVTSGLLEHLENEELEGVLAHELSHIGNYDIRFMTLVTVLVGMVAIISDMFIRGSMLRSFRGNRDRSSGNAVFAILGLVLIILSPIIAQLIKFAVSRRREYLADASGALLTRYPDGLASALQKISRSSKLQRASNATAHLYIANPFGTVAKNISGVFSTHPPIEKRIQALREMGGQHHG
ncbi:MAG: M48 family metallopeptidase [Candidatus Nomurabacteria bacterium]|nr:MAG: M48 family metallopeptidase [Candidatus Nomurabacteria bacterium]